MSRVDAPVYLIPLPLVAAVAWVSLRSSEDRHFLARMAGAVLLGAAPVSVLGLIDVERRAGHYYDDLRTDVHRLQVGLAGSAVLGVAVLIVWWVGGRYLRPLLARLSAHRGAIGSVAGVLVMLAVFGAWLVRPRIMKPREAPVGLVGSLQRVAGLAVDPTRTYAEKSVQWLSWYLGPVTIALAAVGAGFLVARWVRRPDAITTLTLTVIGGGSALYLWQPSITPDQIWAMRRFVPAALPLTVLLAALAIVVIAEAAARRASAAGPVLLAVGALGLILPPALITKPVRNFVPGPGDSNLNLAGVQKICSTTGPDAAILTAYDDPSTLELVGAIRTWCRVPVAYMTRPFTAQEISHLAYLWRLDSRDLWVIGSSSSSVTASAPTVSPELIAATVLPRELEMTIDRAPNRYSVVSAAVYGGPVP